MKKLSRAVPVWIVLLQFDALARAHDLCMMACAQIQIMNFHLPARAARRGRHGVRNLLRRLAGDLLHRPALQPAKMGVDQNIATLGVLAENSHRQLFDQRMIERLRFGPCFLGKFMLGVTRDYFHH